MPALTRSRGAEHGEGPPGRPGPRSDPERVGPAGATGAAIAPRMPDGPGRTATWSARPGGSPGGFGGRPGSSRRPAPDAGHADHHPSGPAAPAATDASAGSLDALVDATPAARDRVVDLLRAASIGVVVLWHWSLSITHWHDGHLVDAQPRRRRARPVGRHVGAAGHARVLLRRRLRQPGRLAGRHPRSGGGGARFLRSRMRRLLGPLVPVARVLGRGRPRLAGRRRAQRPRLGHGRVRPPLVPRRVRRGGAGRAGDGPAARPLAVAGAGGARRGRRSPPTSCAWAPRSAAPVPGLVGSACVWLFCHQLGYFWRDGTLVAAGAHGHGRWSPPGSAGSSS